MAKKLKILVINLLTKWVEDFFILVGVTLIVANTYMRYGVVIGNYLLGFIFLVLGFLLAKK